MQASRFASKATALIALLTLTVQAAPQVNSTSSETTISSQEKPIGMSQTVLIAHVVCMGLSFLVFAPFGAILARYGRTLFAWSFVHRVFQSICGLLAIVGLALGIAYSSLSPTSKGLSSSHASVGLGLFIILVIQFLLGYASHIFFNSQVLKYRAINFVHAGLGITIIGLSFWDVILGAEAWSTAKPHLKVIKYSLLGYGLSIVLIYCLGFLLIPRELENNRLNYNSEHKILKYKLASAPAMNSETHLNQIEKYQSKLSIPKPLEEICGPVSLFYHNTDLKQVVIEESGESGDENQRASVFEDDDEDDEKSMKEIRNSISSRKEKKRKSKDLKRANKSFELVRKNGYKESTSQGKKSPHEFESTSAISASTSLNESTFLGGLDGQDELEDEFNEIRFSGVAL